MTQPQATFDIAIYGAGFVGRTLALLLAQQGLRIALVSSKTTQASNTDIRAKDFRAFALSSASKKLLESLSAWPPERFVTPLQSMQVFGDAGGHVDLDTPASADALSWIVDVPALEAALEEQSAANPYIYCLTEGTALEAKLHVVCEGRALQICKELGIAFETIRYPQLAVAARLVCEQPHHHSARQWFNERGEVLALLPMQGNEVALVWSLESSHATQILAASDTDFCAALEASCNKALGAMQLSSTRALWPLQLTKTSEWTGQSDALGTWANTWVLAGDAAHTVHPLAGQGLNLGLGDAALLAQTIKAVQGDSPMFRPVQTKLLRALQSYARARQAAAVSIAGVTDGLHLLFARDSVLVAKARNLGMTWLNYAQGIKQLLIQKAQ